MLKANLVNLLNLYLAGGGCILFTNSQKYINFKIQELLNTDNILTNEDSVPPNANRGGWSYIGTAQSVNG